jgi:membrane protein insertase Oxa1/YidC/SpoIIIJ
VQEPKNIIDFAYPALQHLGWMQELAHKVHEFDNTLFGIVDLGRSALSPEGLYLPAFLLVIGSAGIQFLTSRQLMPVDKDARKLREIFKAAGAGEQADQTEINAAIGRSTQYIIPVMVFIFTVNLPAALSLYWLTSGIVAYIQQSVALREDEEDMEKLASEGTTPSKDVSKIAEAEIVSEPQPKTPKKKSAKKKSSKRRKK